MGGGDERGALVVPPPGLVGVAGDVVALHDLAGGEEVAAGAGFDLLEPFTVVGDVGSGGVREVGVDDGVEASAGFFEVGEGVADGELLA